MQNGKQMPESKSAARARAAEVAGHKLAAKSGQEYAEQLRQIGSVSQREAFVDLVNRLQEQGLSFDEARAEASRYLECACRCFKTN